MPLYVYTALSENGAQVTGEQAAASLQELNRELAEKGLLVQHIRRKRGGTRLFSRRRIKPEAFLLYNQEFMALARAGLTVPEALALAANRPDNPGLGQILRKVLEDVRGGVSFSEACARHPEAFDVLYVSALKTGEKTGDLANILARYQDYLKHRVALRKKVSHALAYPVFLLITLVVILGVLFAFVLPRFVGIYADFDAQLPWATRLLIALVDHMPFYAPVLLVGGALGWLGYRSWVNTPAGRLWIDNIKERLPFLGRINRTLNVAQLARSLSTLLAGGTPLVDAMRTACESLSNRAYGERLAQATAMVTEGKSLAEAMHTMHIMPDTAVKMIEVGEASGRLDGMLAEVAQFYEETLENRLSRMMTLIEPALMLLIGILVGGIIITMYLPIFNLADVIR